MDSYQAPSSNFPKIFLIAGEASGDLHGAGIVRGLKEIFPGASFHGIGGGQMERAGVKLLFPSSDLAVVGLFEILSHARPIYQAFRKTIRWLRDERPDLLVLIDYPDFNFLVGKRAKKLGIPVFYYICPQVWAWRQGRIKTLRKFVDQIGVILPFEKEFLEKRGLDVQFVGHPLLDVVKAGRSKERFCMDHDIDPGSVLVSLLPGSRSGEIKRMLPLMKDASSILHERRGDVAFVLPVAPSLSDGLRAMIEEEVKGLPVKVIAGETYDAISASDLAMAASGTVTLEAAILDTPVIVTYKISRLTYFLGRRLIKVPYVSLVNLIAGRMIVPEILQDEATAERLALEAQAIIDDRARMDAIKKGLDLVRRKLGSPGAGKRAAALAASLIQGKG